MIGASIVETSEPINTGLRLYQICPHTPVIHCFLVVNVIPPNFGNSYRQTKKSVISVFRVHTQILWH